MLHFMTHTCNSVQVVMYVFNLTSVIVTTHTLRQASTATRNTHNTTALYHHHQRHQYYYIRLHTHYY